MNVLGDVVEQGNTGFAPDARAFSLHAAIYAARPDTRCIVRLHTPATAAVRGGLGALCCVFSMPFCAVLCRAMPAVPQVSAMRCGVLPISRAALLLGDIAYFDFRGEVEDEADRVELQKCLGPTCKVGLLLSLFFLGIPSPTPAALLMPPVPGAADPGAAQPRGAGAG